MEILENTAAVKSDNIDISMLLQKMKLRRSCRLFSDTKIDLEKIKKCIEIAGTAPSGANTQPWFFSVVTSATLKKEIRLAAEKEEYLFYNERASDQFKKDLLPFNTNWRKPYLEASPALIVIFSRPYVTDENGIKKNCYYPLESTGIATGMLITALHLSGYDTLTHTPSPMKFLNALLRRPSADRAMMILVVGHKAIDYQAPVQIKKKLNEIFSLLA